MDGWVIVGTKLDTKQLEKDLKQAERRLQQYEKEAERLTKSKAKAEIDLQPYKEQKQLLEEMLQEELQIASDEISRQYSISSTNAQMIKLNEKYSEQLTNLDNINLKIQENAYNQGLVTNEIAETRKKLGGIDIDFSKIGKSINSVIKKVSRWALAVFGIRGAYMAVRNAINVISQGDEKLASDIEYMKIALAYTIEPIVRGIVNLMKQLMYYVAYIVKAWTGRDIFASANKSLAGANKNAQKLSKTLAGFDEMNVLSDNSSSSSTANSSFDLATPEDAEVPSWIKWIAENKEIIIGALAGIALGLLAIKLADPTTWIVLTIAALATLVAAIIANWDKIKEVLGKVGSWIYDKIIKPVGDFFVGLWDGIVNGVKSTVQWVKDAFSSVVSFFSNLISKIVGLFKTIGTKVGNAIGSAFKIVINGVLKAIESILNFPINSINKLINVINKVPGINISKLPTFSLPRLAVGGVVNMPGRGINYGGANIAEKGPEGVIPLTNSQMMAQLGEAIGKYVTINANITNTMNGRVISRELHKINNNSDFARNV